MDIPREKKRSPKKYILGGVAAAGVAAKRVSAAAKSASAGMKGARVEPKVVRLPGSSRTAHGLMSPPIRSEPERRCAAAPAIRRGSSLKSCERRCQADPPAGD